MPASAVSDLTFGQAVRIVRRSRGLTQAELAEAAKLTRPRLSGIERSVKHLPQGTYSRLVNALGFELGQQLIEAAGLERQKLAQSPRTVATRCESCGTPIRTVGPRRGRPRVRCGSCASDRSALGRSRRLAHPDRVEAYNAARRRSDPAGTDVAADCDAHLRVAAVIGLA